MKLIKVSSYYTFGKKTLTLLIGLITLGVSGVATYFIYEATKNLYIAFGMAVLSVLVSRIAAWLHESSYYRMTKSDIDFHENFTNHNQYYNS